MNLSEIRNKVISGIPVTVAEYAYLLRNDASAFFGFLVQNNPGSLNDILRHNLGYTELTFEPNLKAISRILDHIIDNSRQEEFDFIVNNFKVDTSKVSPELLQALNSDENYIFDLDKSNQRTAQEIAGSIGSSIGSFLNPLFATSTTTTTTAPTPSAQSATGSKGVLIVVVLLVVVVGAIVLFKKQS